MRKGQKNPHVGVPRSPECRAKISAAVKNYFVLPEARERVSKEKKGKPLSPEHIKNRTIAQTGLRRSPEARAHLKEAQNRPEVKRKQSITHMGKGKSAETRRKMGLAKAGIPKSPEHIAKMSGANSSNWRGGISFEPYCPKWNDDLRRRIRAFFDNRCVACGKPQNENLTKTGKAYQLHCHHVTYNKMTCCDGAPVHFTALCNRHHGMTNAERGRWEAILHRIIDEIYNGRSYFTKEEWKEMA